jgi:spermidine synthase
MLRIGFGAKLMRPQPIFPEVWWREKFAEKDCPLMDYFSHMKKIKSKYNGVLEVDTEDGQKVLNSKSTCYSGKTLHDIFIKVFRYIETDDVKSVLLLGLGGGTVVNILRNELNFGGKIVAVELDPVIIDIAVKEFGIQPGKKQELVCMDATEYVRTARGKFDMIICDIFVDNSLPDALVAGSFWKDVMKRLSKEGIIVFNVFHELKKMIQVGQILSDSGMDVRVLPKVNKSNTFLFAWNEQ